MANILDILTRAQALRQETALNSITPDRAGGIMYDTLILINQMQLEGGSLLISKVYSSVAAMEADTTPTSDLTGRALRPGQLAVIVPSSSTSSDMGAVYRYNEPGSWTLCGKIGGLPMDTVPTEGSSNGITSGGVYQLQQEVTTDISQLQQEVDGIIDVTSTPSPNLFDKSAAVSGKYVNKTTGAFASTTNWLCTDYIDISNVEVGADILCIQDYSYSGNVGVAYYDVNKVFTHGGSARTQKQAGMYIMWHQSVWVMKTPRWSSWGGSGTVLPLR